jgi:hypothetical protein
MAAYRSFGTTGPNTDDTPAKNELLEAGWRDQPRHQEMLFDLFFDSEQQANLVQMPGMESVLQKLRAYLTNWMSDTDDPLDKGVVPLPDSARTTDPDSFSPEGDS